MVAALEAGSTTKSRLVFKAALSHRCCRTAFSSFPEDEGYLKCLCSSSGDCLIVSSLFPLSGLR